MDLYLERPRCPTCREQVGEECLYCPGCKTPYHPACLKGDGCLVAGCIGKPVSPHAATVADTPSHLWRYARWAWSSVVVSLLVVLGVDRAVSGSAVVGCLATIAMILVLVAFVLTTAALAHEVAIRPPRQDRFGTLALVLCAACVPLLAGPGRPGAYAPLAYASAGLAVVFSLAGIVIDRRRWRAVAGVAMSAMVALSAVSFFPSDGHRGRSLMRACYANQKTVAGALEMYNLDKNTKVTVLDATMFYILKSGGYLQSIPQDPGQGVDSSAHYHYTPGGNGILCDTHGKIQ